MVQVAIFVCLGWLISVCLHEFGHAIVAYWGGDTSVKDKGYLTLNPLKYIDPGYTLVLPMMFLALGGIGLPGAAVYINTGLLRDRRWKSLVSAAGPLASAIVALCLAGIYKLLAGNFTKDDIFLLGTIERNVPGLEALREHPLAGQWYIPALAFLIFLEVFAIVFNLLPIPSLDGYGIVEPWLPQSWQNRLQSVKRYGVAVLFALFWLSPTFSSYFTQWISNITRVLGVEPFLVQTGYGLFRNSATVLTIGILVAFVVLRRVTLKPYQAEYEKGESLKRTGKWDAAIAAFERAIELKPDFYEALLAKAEVSYQQKHFEDALNAWMVAQELQPSELFIRLNCGLALWNLQRRDEAIAEFERILSIDPNYTRAGLCKAEILTDLQRYDEALAECDRLLASGLKSDPQLESELVKLLTLKGAILQSLHRIEEALGTYQAVSKYKGGLHSTWLGQVEILVQLQRYEEALQVCDRAIQLDPRELDPWLRSAHLFYELQRYEKAISYCEHVVANDPQNYDAWQLQGTCLAQLQHYERALQCYDRAIVIQPENALAYYNKARCYAEQGKVEPAIANLRQAFQRDRGSLKAGAKKDPSFAKLLARPEFNELL
ncbi:tetratricopeptide repeat protein [Pseudanabaena sp. PCC 6802]|uniref:tetratricopeptide repeat protein n=1 Tax=Pseudanabaena sp. PCC 6802 TaxID=118173 RepID=UPI00034CF892|nr:tetratricopeptide repeat protein [Pseudanabaena sp. PCC 6802]